VKIKDPHDSRLKKDEKNPEGKKTGRERRGWWRKNAAKITLNCRADEKGQKKRKEPWSPKKWAKSYVRISTFLKMKQINPI